MENTTWKMSVREFVQPLTRSGSIEQTTSTGGRGLFHLAGIELHTKIQKRMMDATRAEKEVSLKVLLQSEADLLQISGRADLVILDEEIVTIEEIKCTTHPWPLMEEIRANENHPFALQCKMYAFLYAQQFGVKVRPRLRVVSLLDESEFELSLTYVHEIFAEWVMQKWVELLAFKKEHLKRSLERQNTGERLAFPFARSRKGQMQLLSDIQDAIDAQSHFLTQAPTGLGKTAAVLFPLLKKACTSDSKVFYVTAKNSQHSVATETVSRMRVQGDDVRCVSFYSKEKMCLKDEVICNPHYCEYAKGYYDKLSEHRILPQLEKVGLLRPDELKEWGKKFEVCPFELALDFSEKCDVVVCDYNYVFSPKAKLLRYFSDDDAEEKRFLLAVDEAHNLYARGMDYSSPSLSQQTLENFKIGNDDLEESIKAQLERLVEKCVRCLKDVVMAADEAARGQPKKQETGKLVVVKEPFLKIEAQLLRLLQKYAKDQEYLSPKDNILKLCQYWIEYCDTLRVAGAEHVLTFKKDMTGISLKITCCDPSSQLSERLRSFHSVIAFSATLKPFSFHAKLCGFESERIKTAEYESPFPQENRKILIIPQISTAYKDREKNFQKIADVISKVIPLHVGNYFVFFPSFAFLNEVIRLVDIPECEILKQTPAMAYQDIALMLQKLDGPLKNKVIFGVQGGVFSEGIDFPGDKLIGCFVVGPSLPGFDLERECIRDYLQKKYGKGFEYAYVFPAMARVVQAAGRVIRTENDEGLLVLMDKRFLNPMYASCLPLDWFETSAHELVSQSILNDVNEFWSNKQAVTREDVE